MSYESPSNRPAHTQGRETQPVTHYTDRPGYTAQPGYVQPSRSATQPGYDPYPAYAAPAVQPPLSGLAVAGLVVGIIALLTSFIPIVNNISFFVALLGAVLAIVGMVGTKKGAHRGGGMAVAGLVLNVVALIAVLAMQAMCSAVLDSASESLANSTSASSTVAGVVVADGATPPTGQGQPSAADLAPGSAVQLGNGLNVCVDWVRFDYEKYDGSPATGVHVTYTNGGSSEASFNPYDWKGQDAQGAQRTYTFTVTSDEASLNSGTLAPGGTVSGMLFFEGTLTKALYYGSMFDSAPTASWSLV